MVGEGGITSSGSGCHSKTDCAGARPDFVGDETRYRIRRDSWVSATIKGVSVAIVRVVIIVVLLRLLFSPVEHAFVAFPLSGLALLYLVCYFCQLLLTIKAHFSLHFHHSATIFLLQKQLSTPNQDSTRMISEAKNLPSRRIPPRDGKERKRRSGLINPATSVYIHHS